VLPVQSTASGNIGDLNLKMRFAKLDILHTFFLSLAPNGLEYVTKGYKGQDL
jgi:hypothetical protein